MRQLVDAIRKSWSWCGVDPVEIADANAFGNLLIRDERGEYWRLCPEDVYCEKIATSKADLEALLSTEEFQVDWQMAELVMQARDSVGELNEGYSYCLKIPGLLGGEYGGTNLASAPTIELIHFSGSLAEQIKDLPDGAEINLDIVD